MSRSITTPVYRDSGFVFDSVEELARAFADELQNNWEPDAYIYSRYRNPGVVAAERRLAALEQSAWSLLFPSGMAAIDTAFSVFLSANRQTKVLVFEDLYGGTISYLQKILVEKRGAAVVKFPPQNGCYLTDRLGAVIERECPDVLYFETVSNPLLTVADVRQMVAVAHAHKVAVVIDNTFATSVLVRPLDFGADLVIHSATKYLSGHGDITAGVVSGNDTSLLAACIDYRKAVGFVFSPDDAARLSAQLLTFSLRFSRQCSNAALIADFLAAHPRIARVLYPGLHSHPTHEVACQLFENKGFGAMLSFEFRSEDPPQAAELVRQFVALSRGTIPLVPSLGDTITTQLPVGVVWPALYPFPGMIRLSAGIEDSESLLSALAHILDQLPQV